MRKPLILYFHIHQPQRLKQLNFLDIGDNVHYFDDNLNSEIIRRVTHCCYLPVTEMLRQIAKEQRDVRLALSISGPAIRQFEKFAPLRLESLQSLVATGCIEMLGETSHHSLASLLPNDEF